MGRTSFYSCFCMILVIMQGTVYCRPTCSVLEFPEVIGDIVQTRVNESISIHFNLNTKSCSSVPDEFNVKVTRKVNNRVTQVCRIRLKGGTCTLSDTSSSCYCPSTNGGMLFLKSVTKADEGTYTWTWSEQLSGEKQKEISLRITEENKPRNNATQVPQVSTPVPDGKPSREKVTPVPDAERSQDRMSPVPDGERLPDKVTPVPNGDGSQDQMTPVTVGQVSREKVTPVSEDEYRRYPLNPVSHGEQSRDKTTQGPNTKHQESDSMLPIKTRALHQKNADDGVDLKLIIGAIFVGIVLVVVITGTLIYLIRGQRILREAQREGGVCNSPQAPPPPADSREQASDIYDEIPDHQKQQNKLSGDNPESDHQPRTMRSYVKILHPDTKMADQKTLGKFSSPLSSVEYLHPVSLCFDKQAELIVRYTALALENLENPQSPESPES